MGKGKVIVVRDGREKSFPSEQTFDLGELGPFCQLSDPRVSIPCEVWDRVLTAHTAARLRDEEPVPSSEVLALLEKRNAARLQGTGLAPINSGIESKPWAGELSIRSKDHSSSRYEHGNALTAPLRSLLT